MRASAVSPSTTHIWCFSGNVFSDFCLQCCLLPVFQEGESLLFRENMATSILSAVL